MKRLSSSSSSNLFHLGRRRSGRSTPITGAGSTLLTSRLGSTLRHHSSLIATTRTKGATPYEDSSSVTHKFSSSHHHHYYSTTSGYATSSSENNKRGIHDDANQKNFIEKNAEKEVLLATIAQEAELLSSLALTQLLKVKKERSGTSSSSSSATTNTTQDAENAKQAAQTLISLTKDISSLLCNSSRAAEQQQAEDKQDANETTAALQSLHRAFISVISLCIHTIPADPTLILTSLDLARQCNDGLSLPLHLPLYQQLANAIALYAPSPPSLDNDAPTNTAATNMNDGIADSDPHDSPVALPTSSSTRGTAAADMILETSKWVEDTLGMPLDTSFFREPLLTLVKRNQYKQAMNLLLRMDPEIDKNRTLDKLFGEIMSQFTTCAITGSENIDVLLRNITKTSVQQQHAKDDAIELLLMVHQFAVQLLKLSPLFSHSETLGEVMTRLLRSEDRDEELYIDLISSSARTRGNFRNTTSDGVVELSDIIDSMILSPADNDDTTINTNGRSVSDMKVAFQKIITKVNVIRNSPKRFPRSSSSLEPSSFDNIIINQRFLDESKNNNDEGFLQHEKSRDELLFDVYARDYYEDDYSMNIPDISDQFENEKGVGEQGLTYTSMYEDKILKDHMEDADAD